jgi:hypothetical protein
VSNPTNWFAAILSPLAILGWQIYQYLLTGIWTEFSILDLMILADFKASWAYSQGYRELAYMSC